MPSLITGCRRFLHRHANVVDFLGASVLICLCFIILMPKVHESFQHKPTEEHSHDQEPNHNHHDHQHHHHHHHHQLPIGEVLVCAGFFVFYCIGLSFGGCKGDETNIREKEPLLPTSNEKRLSTVCCSSTRCPTDQRESSRMKSFNISPIKSKLSVNELASETLMTTDNEDEDCVFTLNRHHNHHTHSRHHEHPIIGVVEDTETTTTTATKARDTGNYGSMSSKTGLNDLNNSPTTAQRCLVVEQITITTESLPCDDDAPPDWSISVKITLFGLVFAAVLAILDMNIHGLIESFKVFKAAATGALLYVTFMIILPKGPAGCNACAKEEI